MRPLADWLGQTVRYQGYLSHWEPCPNGRQIRYCLSNVRVKPWDASSEERHLDHLWFYFGAEDKIRDRQRLTRYRGVGTVGEYCRTDGTRDFNIQAKHVLNIEETIGKATLLKPSSKTALWLLQKAAEALESEAASLDWEDDPQEILKMVSELRDRCHQQVNVNELYKAMRPRAKRSPTPDPVKFQGQARAIAVGFARR
jgi:hypothetical protein